MSKDVFSFVSVTDIILLVTPTKVLIFASGTDPILLLILLFLFLFFFLLEGGRRSSREA